MEDKFENKTNFKNYDGSEDNTRYAWRNPDGSIITSGYVQMNPIPWKLYGVTRDDEKTWLGDFVSEGEITGFANFFANNPHFEHMEIHEGNNFKYAVMRILGGRND